MTDSATQTFDRYAADYDAPRRRLVPPFDAFYGAAVDALGLLGAEPKRVLDLGAGTGLLSARVAAAHPGAELTLLDGAPAMLEQGRERLGGRAACVVGDLTGELPDGPWCAIVSALAIHHLDDDGKRALYARVHDALAPGGVFVNAEQVLAPGPLLQAEFRRWHEAEARERGVTDDEWAASLERMRHDRWSTVCDQLAWLREGGFAEAGCLFSDRCFAVLVAVKARGEG
ncbi:MAG TPA: class I SAM-dependent methyltransferase [Capillimicrobium sp.]